MNQQAKKNSATHTPKSTAGATSTSASSNVVKMGGEAVKDLLADSANEAKKAQQKAIELSRESATKIVKSADVLGKVASEICEISRENAETAVQCGNLTSSFAKNLSSQFFEYANRAFSDNLELSKEFFTCRTLNDMFDLQSKIMKSNIDNFLCEANKVSDMLFEYGNETIEPVSERISQSSEQLSKAVAGCAE